MLADKAHEEARMLSEGLQWQRSMDDRDIEQDNLGLLWSLEIAAERHKETSAAIWAAEIDAEEEQLEHFGTMWAAEVLAAELFPAPVHASIPPAPGPAIPASGATGSIALKSPAVFVTTTFFVTKLFLNKRPFK